MSIETFDPARFYSQSEVAKSGLCCKTKFWQYVKEGRFQTIKIGNRTKVSGRSLNAFIANLSK